MATSHLPSRRLLVGAVVGLVAVSTLIAAPQASAGADKKEFSAAVTPTSVIGGQRVSFVVAVTNSNRSNSDLGSVQLVVPAGFSGLTLNTAPTTPSGWQAVFPASCSSGSPSGCGAPGSTLVEIRTPATSGAQKLGAGKTLTFTVSAIAPTTAGRYAWNVAAKNSASWSDGSLFTLTSLQPFVDVAAPATTPTQLAFTSQPSTVTAGTTFGVSVAIRTADGQATTSSAQVTLVGNGTQLYGNTSVAAVNGTANFTGLSLRAAGSFTLTASSGSLTQAVSTSISVSPGIASQLVITSPSPSPEAGQSFSVTVEVRDQYSNPVSGVPVTLSVGGGTGSSSSTGAAGQVTLGGIAPTTAGLASLTVSSGSLLPISQSFSVTAGPATSVQISPITPTPTRAAPFDVVVTTRDAFGNLSPYPGTISLAASGGTGVLGSLGGTTTVVPGASPTATISGVTYSGYGNDITLTASGPGLTSGTTTINVYAFVASADLEVGDSYTLQNPGCTDATPGVPVCSSLILPKGANGRVTLGQQICNPFTPCLNSNENQANLVEALADLSGIYSRTAPAVLEFRCDKTLCGGTGVKDFSILFQVTGTSAFPTAPACTTKGRIGANQTFCADVKANHRDNAGDLVATVLFLEDLRSTIKP